MRANPRGVLFDDLAAVLRDHGYEQRPGKGSHVVFKNPETGSFIPIPKQHGSRRVKEVYVRRVLKALGGDDG